MSAIVWIVALAFALGVAALTNDPAPPTNGAVVTP
jgi:hypothetical protein